MVPIYIKRGKALKASLYAISSGRMVYRKAGLGLAYVQAINVQKRRYEHLRVSRITNSGSSRDIYRSQRRLREAKAPSLTFYSNCFIALSAA